LAETEIDDEVTEVRWEAGEDAILVSEVMMALEIEVSDDGAEDTAEEAVALKTTCVCLWSAIDLRI